MKWYQYTGNDVDKNGHFVMQQSKVHCFSLYGNFFMAFLKNKTENPLGLKRESENDWQYWTLKHLNGP